MTDSESNTLHSKHKFKTDYATTEYIQPFLRHKVLAIIGMHLRQITLKLMSATTVCIIHSGSTSDAMLIRYIDTCGCG